jgi:hypothetical protein
VGVASVLGPLSPGARYGTYNPVYGGEGEGGSSRYGRFNLVDYFI